MEEKQTVIPTEKPQTTTSSTQKETTPKQATTTTVANPTRPSQRNETGTGRQPAPKPQVDVTRVRQEFLNRIVQRRINESKGQIFKQFGVNTIEELTSLVNKAKGYDELNGKFYAANNELTTLKAEKVAQASGVRAEKVEDLLIYLKGKGLDYTQENIQTVAQSHPEWLSDPKQEVVQPATIGKIGQTTKPVVSDVEKARQLFPSLRK